MEQIGTTQTKKDKQVIISGFPRTAKLQTKVRHFKRSSVELKKPIRKIIRERKATLTLGGDEGRAISRRTQT